jgi:hypothetical protein
MKRRLHRREGPQGRRPPNASMGRGRCQACGNRGPNRGRPCRFAPRPPPTAAPGPPFPQAFGNRLPAHPPAALHHPPSPLSTPPTAPATMLSSNLRNAKAPRRPDRGLRGPPRDLWMAASATMT